MSGNPKQPNDDTLREMASRIFDDPELSGQETHFALWWLHYARESARGREGAIGGASPLASPEPIKKPPNYLGTPFNDALERISVAGETEGEREQRRDEIYAAVLAIGRDNATPREMAERPTPGQEARRAQEWAKQISRLAEKVRALYPPIADRLRFNATILEEYATDLLKAVRGRKRHESDTETLAVIRLMELIHNYVYPACPGGIVTDESQLCKEQDHHRWYDAELSELLKLAGLSEERYTPDRLRQMRSRKRGQG